MRTLLSIALISLFSSLSAQETINYPYNPDGDVDGTIASPDLLDILGVYGNAFTPTEIQIDGVGLLEVIQNLQNQITLLQDNNDLDNENELQTLSLDGDTLGISSGNYIVLNNSINAPHSMITLNTDTLEVFTVPQNVRLIEVTINGGKGGNGSGTSNCYNGNGSGGGGGFGGMLRFVVYCNPGDTLLFNVGSDGQDGVTNTDVGCHEGVDGTNGSPTSIIINGNIIATAYNGTLGTGGWRYWSGNTSWPGDDGENGGVALTSFFMQSGFIHIESGIGDTSGVLIRY